MHRSEAEGTSPKATRRALKRVRVAAQKERNFQSAASLATSGFAKFAYAKHPRSSRLYSLQMKCTYERQQITSGVHRTLGRTNPRPHGHCGVERHDQNAFPRWCSSPAAVCHSRRTSKDASHRNRRGDNLAPVRCRNAHLRACPCDALTDAAKGCPNGRAGTPCPPQPRQNETTVRWRRKANHPSV